MVTGIVVPAAAEQTLEEREFANLEDYQAAVGGWIEAVDLPDFGVTIYVKDEGLLRQLPLNSRASFLWWYHVPAARQKRMLVGDVIIVGLPDSYGDSTDVPAGVRELLLAPATYRVEVQTFDDPKWYSNQATYPDYWEALVWGMVLLERWTAAEVVRIVRVESKPIAASAA